MYEFLVLSLLMAGPMHGYGMRQIMDRIMGPYRSVAWGPLYGALRSLETAGLIAIASEDMPVLEVRSARGGPPSKLYRITEAGQARFHHLMAPPESSEADYQFMFCLKLARLGLVPVEERLALLRHYSAYARAHLDHLARWSEYVAADERIAERDRPWILATMDHSRAIWEADLAWVERRMGDGCAMPDGDATRRPEPGGQYG